VLIKQKQPFQQMAGGRPHAAEPVIVGENAPELFVPDQSGMVVPLPVPDLRRPEAQRALRESLSWTKLFTSPEFDTGVPLPQPDPRREAARGKNMAAAPSPFDAQLGIGDVPSTQMTPKSIRNYDWRRSVQEPNVFSPDQGPEPVVSDRPPPMTVLPPETPMQADPRLREANFSDDLLGTSGLRLNDAAWGAWLESRPESENVQDRRYAITDPRNVTSPGLREEVQQMLEADAFADLAKQAARSQAQAEIAAIFEGAKR
jgi:hypothetical protein